jgi:hypothetical protein
VLDISGKSFCSSERSKSANPTALTVKQLLNLTYGCKDGRVTVKTFCQEGLRTFCSQVGVSGRVCMRWCGLSCPPLANRADNWKDQPGQREFLIGGVSVCVYARARAHLCLFFVEWDRAWSAIARAITAPK